MIALIQLNLLNDIEYMFEMHRNYINSVAADLLVFPECSLAGYDQNNFQRFQCAKLQKVIWEKIKLLEVVCSTQKKMALVGAPILENGRLYNCSILLGEEKGNFFVYRKRSLTEIENEYFLPGKESLTFELKGERIGVLICRDQSNITLFKDYMEQGVSKIIIQAAHYYHPKVSLWKKDKNYAIPIARALDFGIDVYKANAVGFLNGCLSCGGTIAVSSYGKILGRLNEFSENVLSCE